jgi:hypothetical protein
LEYAAVAAVIELKQLGVFWQITHNEQVIAFEATRQSAIDAAGWSLRHQLNDPTVDFSFIGLELAELLAASKRSPYRKQKGPRVEVELVYQAESHLQTELVSADESELIGEYRAALRQEDFAQALECLVQLGELQDCSNPFWQILERLIEAVWPTQWMVDSRAKGLRETKIAAVRSRARGHS